MTRPLIALSAQRYPAGRLYKLEPAFAVISDYVDAVWRAGGMPMPGGAPAPAAPQPMM